MTAPELVVNGRARALVGVDPATTTLDWLRGQGLTGAKEGCAEGECGACAVLVARPSDDGSGTVWTALNACLTPVAALDGGEVVTAEGLGSPDDLHPVQAELATRGGSQCGYCTPGFVCSMAAEFYRDDRTPGEDGDAEHGPNGFDLHALSGNLCRCTGYRPIRDAAWALGEAPPDDPLSQRRRVPAPEARATRLMGRSGAFTRPTTLAEAAGLLADHPDAVLVAGSTDWGVEVNLRGARAAFAIAVDRLPELRRLETTADRIELGAALTLTEVERRLRGAVPLLDEVMPQFASRPIRNAATIGGNLGTASPIGDLPPALLALEAGVVLSSQDGSREVPLELFWTGYRQTVRRHDEIIESIRIPLPLKATTAFHKIAKRRFDDISSVAVACALDIAGGVVRTARIGLGGVAATPIRARATETTLEGRPWTADTVRAAAAVLRGEGTPLDDHRASADYRRAMLGSALLRLHADTTEAVDA
jgi:xanthine dehydrogenase small subunit